MSNGADNSSAVRWPALRSVDRSFGRWLGVSRRQFWRGMGVGGAFGIIAACAWFGVAAGTTQKQAFLIPVVGAAIAFGVHKGMSGHGRAHSFIAVVLTAVIVIITMYYVERMLIVRWFAEFGDQATIPLVPYLDWFWSVLRRAFTTSASPAVYTAFALVAAGWLGHQGFESPPVRHHDA